MIQHKICLTYQKFLAMPVEHDLPIIGQIKSINIINGNVVTFYFNILWETSQGLCDRWSFRRDILLSLNLIPANTNAHLKLLEETFCYHSTLYLQTPIHIQKSQVLPTKQFVILPCTL